LNVVYSSPTNGLLKHPLQAADPMNFLSSEGFPWSLALWRNLIGDGFVLVV